jgi:hypothetical protein
MLLKAGRHRSNAPSQRWEEGPIREHHPKGTQKARAGAREAQRRASSGPGLLWPERCRRLQGWCLEVECTAKWIRRGLATLLIHDPGGDELLLLSAVASQPPVRSRMNQADPAHVTPARSSVVLPGSAVPGTALPAPVRSSLDNLLPGCPPGAAARQTGVAAPATGSARRKEPTAAVSVPRSPSARPPQRPRPSGGRRRKSAKKRQSQPAASRAHGFRRPGRSLSRARLRTAAAAPAPQPAPPSPSQEPGTAVAPPVARDPAGSSAGGAYENAHPPDRWPAEGPGPGLVPSGPRPHGGHQHPYSFTKVTRWTSLSVLAIRTVTMWWFVEKGVVYRVPFGLP